jgi:hypothetical protein
MSKSDDSFAKIEAGQILNPDRFPHPNELVCIEVPKVFDQVALRDSQPINVMLLSLPTVSKLPTVSFDFITDFNITNVKMISNTDSLAKPNYKKVKLLVTLGFKVVYSVNGVQQAPKNASALFNLVINEIYSPDCLTQMAVIRSNEDDNKVSDPYGTSIKVEALADAFNDEIITSTSGENTVFTLSIDIGAFFVAKCECVVQLLIPTFGYSPVPEEQQNPTTITRSTFNDKSRTPFPQQFFPDQKWNPLDKSKKEEWDD